MKASTEIIVPLSSLVAILQNDRDTYGQKFDRISRLLTQARWRRSDKIHIRYRGKAYCIHVRKHTSDHYTVWQCFRDNQYDVPVVWAAKPFHKDALDACYKRILKANKKPLILDFGANIGASVVWFNANYPDARIIAVEPAPANAGVLRRNTASLENVVVVEGGVGKETSTLYLNNLEGGAWGYRTTDVVGAQKVAIFTIDDIMTQFCGSEDVPFIVKVDIEGSEKSLFSRNNDAIARFPLIIVEPHDYCMPADSVTTPFFAFHASSGRDFLFGSENISSFDANTIREYNVT